MGSTLLSDCSLCVVIIASVLVSGCRGSDALTGGARTIENPTSPSVLQREVDDIPAGSGDGQTACLGDYAAQPYCFPPGPPQAVFGQLMLTAVDGSTLRDSYATKTALTGIPLTSFLGNFDAGRMTFSGTRRFAQLQAIIFSVQFTTSSSVTFVLKYGLRNPEPPYDTITYGDSVKLPFVGRRLPDATCTGGHRLTGTFSGQMENIGRFTGTINHCVSASL